MANHPNQWFQASVKFHKIKGGVSVTDSASSTYNTKTEYGNEVNNGSSGASKYSGTNSGSGSRSESGSGSGSGEMEVVSENHLSATTTTTDNVSDNDNYTDTHRKAPSSSTPHTEQALIPVTVQDPEKVET